MLTKGHNWQRWLQHGAWAVADQGLYAVSNVFLNVLLARWLVPEEYGAFAVAYSAFLLIGAFHAALLVEPMLVFGSGRYAGRLAGYLRVLVCGNWALTTAGSMLLVVAGAGVWFFGPRPLACSLFGLAAAAPFTLFMWLMKRAAYVRQQTGSAAAQSAIYLLLILLGLSALWIFQAASVFSVLLLMGFAGLAAGLWLMRRLRAVTFDTEGPPAPRVVLAQHWNYGRWALLTGILLWAPLNFYFTVLSAWGALEASATLKALTNLVLPLLQVNAALSALLLPLLAARAGDRVELRRLLCRALALFSAVAVLYALAVGALGGSLIRLFFGGRYHESSSLLWLLALVPVLDGVAVVLACALRSLGQPQQVFRAHLFAAACVPAVGIAATAAWGVAGAAGAMVLAGLVATALLAVSVSKHLAEPTLLLKPAN